MLGFWLLIVLLLALIVAMPWYPYSREWGYTPGAVVVLLLLFWLFAFWFGWLAVAWPWAV